MVDCMRSQNVFFWIVNVSLEHCVPRSLDAESAMVPDRVTLMMVAVRAAPRLALPIHRLKHFESLVIEYADE